MGEQLIKAKLIKYESTYDDDLERYVNTISEGVDWEEFTKDQLKELRHKVDVFNRFRYALKTDYSLMVIEQHISLSEEISLKLDAALKLADAEKLRVQKEAEKRAADKVKRDASAIERKKKQLEKLQQEINNGVI